MLVNRSSRVSAIAQPPGLAWEETSCLLCGRDDSRARAEAADFSPATGPGLRFGMVECLNCGLVYTNPRPTAESIGRFYPDNYRPHAPRGQRVIRLPSSFWSRLLGRPCPERRGRLPWTGMGRLLDFGCGGGSYLRRMSELGWRVVGLDISARVADTVRRDIGAEVHIGSLPHPDLMPESTDVVTMWQSLEHVHNPLKVLRAAYELLSPGGAIVIAVPNYGSLAARWFGEFWFGLDLPRHLTHFTRATLGTMLQAAGFRIESVRGLVHYQWLRASALRAANNAHLGKRILQYKTMARAAAWGCYALGQADSLVAVARRPSE